MDCEQGIKKVDAILRVMDEMQKNINDKQGSHP